MRQTLLFAIALLLICAKDVRAEGGQSESQLWIYERSPSVATSSDSSRSLSPHAIAEAKARKSGSTGSTSSGAATSTSRASPSSPAATTTATSTPPPPASSSGGGINCKKYSGTMYDSCMRINERTGHGGGSPTGSGKYPDVGGNGILWKPTSDSDGKLVVLTKTSLGTPTVEILDANGNVIEKGRYVYHANGNRAHYRFSKSGRSYPNGSLLRVNGKIYEVPQTWKRYE